jgi:hypothetical protein
MKIMIPISFLVMLLQWSGWLNEIDFLLKPLMGLLNLPGEAALPVIIGMLIGPYGSIAAMAVLPFSIEQMTLIAIFNLIAHSLIMEGIIQHNSGMHFAKAIAIRIAAAIVTVYLVSLYFGNTGQSLAIASADLISQAPLLEALKDWAVNTAILLAKLFGIIMSIMVLLEVCQTMGWTEYITKFFRPLMTVMRVPQQTAMIWVTAAIFGLLLGGAIIVEEVKKGTLTREETQYLHTSIGINHSMAEDPIIYMTIGLNYFWMLLPRLVMGIIVVQVYHAINYLINKLQHH